MKSSDLRIGNYVMVDNDLRIEHLYIHKITEIRTLDCQVQLNDMSVYGQYYKFIKPIPLTEQWLLDFGFYKQLRNEFQAPYEKISFHYDTYWCSIFICTDIHDIQIEHIKHVHQLQNLYFALTGEELKLNK